MLKDDESPCATCSIDEIVQCCNQLPLDGGLATDERAQSRVVKRTRTVDGREEVTKHRVCVYLGIERDDDRKWQAYCTASEDERPSRCSNYQCHKFYDIE